jgi:hypothetical protein
MAYPVHVRKMSVRRSRIMAALLREGDGLYWETPPVASSSQDRGKPCNDRHATGVPLLHRCCVAPCLAIPDAHGSGCTQITL